MLLILIHHKCNHKCTARDVKQLQKTALDLLRSTAVVPTVASRVCHVECRVRGGAWHGIDIWAIQYACGKSCSIASTYLYLSIEQSAGPRLGALLPLPGTSLYLQLYLVACSCLP